MVGDLHVLRKALTGRCPIWTVHLEGKIAAEGNADKVMAELRRMRERGLKKSATITTVVLSGDRPRFRQSYILTRVCDRR
jgi:hypothetical protein